ncbi:hypothetical protein V8E55_010342 [Tylopilus felleus]
MKNSNIILKFNSTDAVIWLHKEENKACFFKKPGTPANFKNHSYSILVPFLSVRSPLEDPNWLHTI